MPRRMSVALTLDAVRARTKTVTRRHVDTWRTLAPGDRLVLVEKGQGIPRGGHQTIVDEVTVTDVRVEPLAIVDADEVTLEGLSSLVPHGSDPATFFVRFWLGSHGYHADDDPAEVMVRRIAWAYDT